MYGANAAVRALALLLVALWSVGLSAQARGGAPPGRGGPPPTPRAAALTDLTGQWVSLVTEDWRYRMFTAPKGDTVSLPLNPAGQKAAAAWDPAKDEAAGEQCKAYGAAGIMRMPGRLRITWQDDTTLKVETDAGQQTRLLKFGAPAAPAAPAAKAPPSWQGTSVAQWQISAAGLPLMLRPQERAADVPAPAAVRGGTLKVTTTNLRAGYLRKNGVPYSAGAVLTEYWDLTKAGNDTLLTVTQIVDDPTYLRTRRLIAYPFKKEANGDTWDPTPCSARW